MPAHQSETSPTATNTTRPRILFVSNCPPVPTYSGGNQRTYLILRALQLIGDVTLALLTHDVEEGSEQLKQIRQICDCRIIAPSGRPSNKGPSSRLKRITDMARFAMGAWKASFQKDSAAVEQLKRLGKFDVVVGRYLQTSMTANLISLGHAVVDVDDAPYEIYKLKSERTNVGGLKRWLAQRQFSLLPKILVPFLKQCKATWVAKSADRSWPGLENAHVLPNIPVISEALDHSPDLPDAGSTGPVVLFIGTLWWPPNFDGINWFLANVWPEVHATVPDAKIMLAGRGATPEMISHWTAVAGVDYVGEVKDVTSVYARAGITICPAFSGGGTNIKVVESLAYGRPCVLTPHAWRGYESTLKDGEAVAIGHDAAEMTNQLKTLLQDPKLRSKMGQRGQELVATHFSFAAFAEIVRLTLAPILNNPEIR